MLEIVERTTEITDMEDKEDKVLIISHGDCDGVCSAAIALKYYKQADILFSQPFILKGVLRDEKVKKAKTLVILDLALDDHVVDKLTKMMLYKHIIVIDHHPQTVKFTNLFDGLIDTSLSASQLTSIYFQIPTVLAQIGAIGDKILMISKNDPLFKESELIRESLSYDVNDNDFRIKLTHILANDQLPSEVPEIIERAEKSRNEKELLTKLVLERIKYDNKFIYIDATDLPIEGKVSAIAGVIATRYEKPIFILFKTNTDVYVLTSRCNYVVKDINLDKIMQHFGGGGHKYAASARVKDKNIKILDELIKIFG